VHFHYIPIRAFYHGFITQGIIFSICVGLLIVMVLFFMYMYICKYATVWKWSQLTLSLLCTDMCSFVFSGFLEAEFYLYHVMYEHNLNYIACNQMFASLICINTSTIFTECVGLFNTSNVRFCSSNIQDYFRCYVLVFRSLLVLMWITSGHCFVYKSPQYYAFVSC